MKNYGIESAAGKAPTRSLYSGQTPEVRPFVRPPAGGLEASTESEAIRTRGDGMLLEVLPAEEGDCLLLTCRSGGIPHHVLIDGGTPSTATGLLRKLESLPGQRLELMVVTHIDSDHIGGIARLLNSPPKNLPIQDTWFNGFKHLPRNRRPGDRGLPQAEQLTAILSGIQGGLDLGWNKAFRQQAVMRQDDDPRTGETTADLPEYKLPWGLQLTLLSPTPARLDALFPNWMRYINELRRNQPSEETPQPSRRPTRGRLDLEELAAARSVADGSAPNGSSIAFLAEFAGRSIIFAADAFPSVLHAPLRRLARLRSGAPAGVGPREVPPLHVDVFKLPHHGSQANVSLDLFNSVRAKHYVVSTNGDRFKHPDEEAMARVITKGGPGHTIWFNYRTGRTDPWDDEAWKGRYGYATVYPQMAEEGISIFLPALRASGASRETQTGLFRGSPVS